MLPSLLKIFKESIEINPLFFIEYSYDAHPFIPTLPPSSVILKATPKKNPFINSWRFFYPLFFYPFTDSALLPRFFVIKYL